MLADILADLRTGRLQWLHVRDESLAPLIPALADLPASSRMRLTVMVGDEQQLRPVLAAVAPIVRTLLLAEPRRGGGRPRMASFPFMPRLECIVHQPSDEERYQPTAHWMSIVNQLLIPHAATLRHIVLRRLPGDQDRRYLSRLGAALRSMPRLESLAICPSGIMRMYVVPVARFSVFGGPEENYHNAYHPTCPLLPLPGSLAAITLVLVKDYGRGPSGPARFLPDTEHLPRTIRRVCFFQSDNLTRVEVRGAVAGLFEALPALQRVEDYTVLNSYERGRQHTPLVTRSVRERAFHDCADAFPSSEELCAEIEGRSGGWDELAVNPCVTMLADSRSNGGGLGRILSPLAEAARRCAGIMRFVVCPGLDPLHERGAEAVAAIMADHPEMRELTFHCPSASDEACGLIAAAVRAHPHLRIVRVSMKRSEAPWKQQLLLAVLEANAARRRCDLDRAAWDVVMAGVRREMELVADGRQWTRHILPWHMHSISGRIADYLGHQEPRQMAFVSEDSAFDHSGWMMWFLPGRALEGGAAVVTNALGAG